MCVSLESCYHDFVTFFAGRYRNYNSVVIWSLSINTFEIMFTWCYVIRIILLTFEYHLKTLYWCLWYFKKRRGDSFSSEVAFILQMAYNNIFEFWAAARGYHYNRRFWISQKDKILECFFETHNPFDRFAIKACKVESENAVGHLPWEILRVTKFFMDRGAIMLS